MNKRIIAIIISVIFCISHKGYTQNTDSILTLKQCVDIAIANNLQIKQAELQSDVDHINLKQAKGNRLPQVVADLNHGLNQGRSIDPFTNTYNNQNITYGNYNLSGSIALFNGGQLKNTVAQNKLLFAADKMDVQQSKEDITLNIILDYLQILTEQDLLAQSKSQYELTQKQVERLEILNKEGSIIPAQLYELKGQLANDELSMVNNQNLLDAARLLLCQQMNIPYKAVMLEKVITENPQVYEGNPQQIYQSALAQFPSVRAAILRRQSEAAAIRAAKGIFYPRIGLGTGVNTNFSSAATKDIFLNSVEAPSGDFVDVSGTKIPVITNVRNSYSQKIKYFDQFSNNYNTSVNLNINIPILNYNQAKNKVALAKVQFKNAEFLEQSSRTKLSQSIEQAYFNMTAAFKTYTTLQKQVSDFSEAFRIAEARFNSGATNQVEYLIAKNNLDKANSNLIIAQYDYVLRTKILDYYQGKLVL